jgi:pimeloyl-ACP methyl ester carboxylesterase
LIIHGNIDKIIPIEKPLEVYKNWEGSKFLELKNLGHSKILRSDEAINSLLNFLKK